MLSCLKWLFLDKISAKKNEKPFCRMYSAHAIPIYTIKNYSACPIKSKKDYFLRVNSLLQAII